VLAQFTIYYSLFLLPTAYYFHERFEDAVKPRHRQAHHVRVATRDASDEFGCEPLDRIGARLIQRLTAFYVIANLFLIKLPEGNMGCFVLERLDFGWGPYKAYAGVHLVGPARQKAEHARGILPVGRLSQRFTVDDDYRIRTQNDAVWR